MADIKLLCFTEPERCGIDGRANIYLLGRVAFKTRSSDKQKNYIDYYVVDYTHPFLGRILVLGTVLLL